MCLVGVLIINEMDNKLHYMRSEPPLMAPVFRSESQSRLLANLLLGGDELTLNQLADRSSVPYATAHREVARLLDAGILTERTVGRARLLTANPHSPLVNPLRKILAVASGPVLYLADELSAIAGIEVAFIYGSFAARASGITGPPPDDIDVMVIGAPDADAIYEACERVEGLVGRPVNPTILTAEEARSERTSAFMQSVSTQSRLPLIGEWS